MGRTRLLVSVRDEEEAEEALLGGADLIDIKEPAQGALGKAADEVIRAIARRLEGRVPVSAALGEWDENATPPMNAPLAFVKWGPARAARRVSAWRAFLTARMGRQDGPQPVLVAYADWKCAQAPPLDDLVDLACQRPGSVLLIDTHCKDAAGAASCPTLLDWLPLPSVLAICARCRQADVRIALAGSLGPEEISDLSPGQPDWFAVRGAVCEERDRMTSIRAARVRTLRALILQLTR